LAEKVAFGTNGLRKTLKTLAAVTADSVRNDESTVQAVLPTNFKNFLQNQPKNSAAGEKVRPPHNID
jgi:hypothetical protein